MILSNSLNGLYSFRRELIEELIKEKHEVIIAAPSDKKASYFVNLGCKYIETSISRRGTNPITDLRLLFRYHKVIKAIKPDILLTYTIKPNIYGSIIARILNIPYITNITGLGTVVENKGILQKITIFLYRVALKEAKFVFFQNSENRLFFQLKKIAIGKHRLIPGSGVNLEHFKVMDYPTGKKVEFLFIARIIKEKGIDHYLDSAEYFKHNYPNTEFHILGDCEESYINKIKKMHEQKIIVYHGRQDDIREYIKASSCVIHPSYYPEGMSNVLLESAASGRPVITTNRAGCKEIVEDKKSGYLIAQHSSKDLINKMEQFIKLDLEQKVEMGLNGRIKVEKEFDRKIVVKTYVEAIKVIG